MSLSAVSVGEHWADDGDYDEPEGDRPDGCVARSGGWQDQDSRRIDVAGAWAASGVSAGEGVWRAWPAGAGAAAARQAEQPPLSGGLPCRRDRHQKAAPQRLCTETGAGDAWPPA